MCWPIERKIYCLYALEFDEKTGCFIKPDNKILKFGDTAVIIHDTRDFFEEFVMLCQTVLEMILDLISENWIWCWLFCREAIWWVLQSIVIFISKWISHRTWTGERKIPSWAIKGCYWFCTVDISRKNRGGYFKLAQKLPWLSKNRLGLKSLISSGK